MKDMSVPDATTAKATGAFDKTRRAYISRWEMFEHQFNPHGDLMRNTQSVVEFSGNKPDSNASSTIIFGTARKT